MCEWCFCRWCCACCSPGTEAGLSALRTRTPPGERSTAWRGSTSTPCSTTTASWPTTSSASSGKAPVPRRHGISEVGPCSKRIKYIVSKGAGLKIMRYASKMVLSQAYRVPHYFYYNFNTTNRGLGIRFSADILLSHVLVLLYHENHPKVTCPLLVRCFVNHNNLNTNILVVCQRKYSSRK